MMVNDFSFGEVQWVACVTCWYTPKTQYHWTTGRLARPSDIDWQSNDRP